MTVVADSLTLVVESIVVDGTVSVTVVVDSLVLVV